MEKKEIITHTLSMYIECLKYILILIMNSTYAHFSNTEVQNRPTHSVAQRIHCTASSSVSWTPKLCQVSLRDLPSCASRVVL